MRATAPPDGCATGRTTEPTTENTIGTLPPRRPGASPGSPGHPGHPNYPEYPEHPEHPEHPGAAPPPDCNRRTGKGRAFGRFSLLLWSGKRNSHSRCARAVREYWQTPPAPGRGALRSQVPSPSCTGIQKQKGESLKILPFALERKTGLALRASGSRILADTPGPWKGRFEVAGAESLMHRHTKAKGRISEDSPFCFGAENGTRTRDLNLGKVALYQLSYFRISPRRTTSERSLTRVLGLQI